MTFGARLAEAMDVHGPLSVGIDPTPALLAAWGLPDSPAGLRSMGQAVLGAAQDSAAAVKPQAAYFERHGSAGMAVLEELLGMAREQGTLTILDAKRGDIPDTMAAYADSCLRPGAPFEADALTASPYLGFDALAPAFELAAQHGKGVFVLCLTSNPEGASLQHARTPGGPAVAAEIASGAASLNQGAAPMGSIGLVVGATVGPAAQALAVPLSAVNGPLLAPGVGAQGAGPQQLREVFGAARSQVLAHQSRAVLAAGPVQEKLQEAVRRASQQAHEALRGQA